MRRFGARAEELRFWREWLRTEGMAWPDDFARRTDPEGEVEDSELIACLEALGQKSATVLDVGAGPLTSVGRRAGACRVAVTAVDPLAKRYDGLLAEAGLEPPVRTRPGDAERVDSLFPAQSFDIAYSRNALDHARRPLQAMRAMVTLVRPGGFLVLRHRRNEAEAERYTGMHRWNFEEVDGRLLLWRRRRDRAVDVSAALAPGVSLKVRQEYEFVVASGRRET